MTWVAAVSCDHRAALGHRETVRRWSPSTGCSPATRIGGREIGVVATDHGRLHVLQALRRLAVDDLPVASLLARLTAGPPLPRCSVLVAQADELAGLAWGRPLHLLELDAGQYAVGAEPAGADWQAVQPGTVLALDPCGATVFRLPYSDPDEENL